jgi:ubiquitin C-terminal hydrolase
MLQCFLSCTSALRVFDQNPDGLRTRNELCAAVWQTIVLARKKTKSEFSQISEMSIRIWEAFRRQMKLMNISTTIGGGMEDAHEGFVKFLEAFDAPEIEELFEHRYKTVVQCGMCGDRRDLKDDKNKTQIDSRVFCEFALEDFQNCVDPCAPENVQNLILQRDNETDKDYRCSTCGEKNVHKKTERFVFTPEVLILLFEKWEHTPGARRATYKRWAADAPDTITIPGHGDSEIHYRRVAMSEHGGDTDGGHYWAHALRSTGGDAMHRLDDTRVSGPREVGSTVSTYMVWYHVV